MEQGISLLLKGTLTKAVYGTMEFIVRGFINIFSRMATGYHSHAKLFELNL